MSEYSLRLTGLSCGSCEKLIEKAVSSNGGVVKEIDTSSGVVVIDCDDSFVGKIKSALAQRGFLEISGDVMRGDFSRFFDYVRGVVFSKPGFEVEALLLNYSLVSALFVFLISVVFYFAFLFSLNNPFSYLHILVFSFLVSLPVSFSFFHVSFYRRRLSCQLGMMVGMITGMVSGFLVGALIGATNGMFFGSVLGVLVGVLIGLWLGRYCGVMGAVEGLLGGIMSGVMGAMTSVMLYYDNLVVFLYFVFFLCILVLGALSYMLYREGGSCFVSENNSSRFKFVALVVLFFLFLVCFAFFGPKSSIVYVW